MIANNPNPCITNCVMQVLIWKWNPHTTKLSTLSSCRQSVADECWKGLLGRDPTSFCVWCCGVLWTCQGAGLYRHQEHPAGMYVYCLVTTVFRNFSLEENNSRHLQSKSVSCVVHFFMWSLNWTVRAHYLILIRYGPIWLWANVCICINYYCTYICTQPLLVPPV